MRKTKKTKRGVDLKSTAGIPIERKPIWWLAVLEGTRFQTFSYSWANETLICQHDSHLSSFREKTSQRVRDSAGRSYDSFSRTRGGHQTASPRHSYSSPFSPNQLILRETAKLAAKHLEQARRNQAFDSLVIVAEAPQLGFLRKHLSPATMKRVELEIVKTFPRLPTQQRLKLLTSFLPLNIEKAPRNLPRIRGA